ncbi:MAG: hypothetical protein Q9221_004727 [Calogaya cf. arnoldii]
MEWNHWSGFVGDGKYIIINRKTHLCLELSSLETVGDYISLRPHTPNNPAQLWRITQRPGWDGYGIWSDRNRDVVISKGPYETLPANLTTEQILNNDPAPSPSTMVWLIDRAMYAMEPGRMVAFRSVKYPGFVLQQNESSSVAFASLGLGRPGQWEQKWLLRRLPD